MSEREEEIVARASFKHWRDNATAKGFHMDRGMTFEDMSDSEREFALSHARAVLAASRPLILEEAAKVADEMAVNRARVSGVAEHACKSIASRIRSLSPDGKAPAKEGDAG